MNGSMQEQIQELQDLLTKSMHLQFEFAKSASEHLIQTQAWHAVLAAISLRHYGSLSDPIQSAKQDSVRLSEGLRKQGDEKLANRIEQVYKAIIDRLEAPDDASPFPDFGNNPTIH